MIGEKIEIKYFDWKVLSGRGDEILEEAECVCLAVHILLNPHQSPNSPTSSLSTAPISRSYPSMSPGCLWCLSPVHVPSTSYKGHVLGTGQTETMEVSDSLSRNTYNCCKVKTNVKMVR
jgi:hypothetical protein